MYSEELIALANCSPKNILSRSGNITKGSLAFVEAVRKECPDMVDKYSFSTIKRLIKAGIEECVCKVCHKDISHDSRLPKYCSMECYKSDPEASERLSAIKRELYRDQEWKLTVEAKKMATNTRNFGRPHPMQNPESFEKQKMSSFKKKDVKGMSLQGFEPNALEYLSMFQCSIIQGSSSSTSLSYIDQEGKCRYSFPDFYCEELNSFIEVKSHYTYSVAKDSQIKNAISACKDKRKGYIVMIVEPRKSVLFMYFNQEYIPDL